ncbi:MAG: carbohydrate kinase, partial [Gammaproteobacteria bacterium]
MLFIGIDAGTSSLKALAIDEACNAIAESAAPIPPPRRQGCRVTQDPELWWQALEEALDRLLAALPREEVKAIAVDGTSGTLLVTDERGRPLSPALMYNDACAAEEARGLRRLGLEAPSLAKLLGLPLGKARHALHQADWLSGRLMGTFGVTDLNNALKLGFDPLRRTWPDAIQRLGIPFALLPEVVEPGTPLAPLSPE